MAFYLVQLAYTSEAAKAMVKNPQSREDVARKAIESVGGKLHSFYFSFGEYDAAIIAEAPNNVAAAGVALAAAAGGALSKFHTTTLLTTAEGIEAMKAANKAIYAPPK